MARQSHYPTLELLESRTLLATCHVTRLGDFGAGADIGGGHFSGDLRYCINKVNAVPRQDTINIEVTGTINLTTPLPDLASDIIMHGPGADLLTVRRASQTRFRILTVGYLATVQISGLTITNGSLYEPNLTIARGAGIMNEGVLLLRSTVVTENSASSEYGSAYGGGIYNAGILTIIDSSITGNRASPYSTGRGAGVYNSAKLTIVNSLISENVADSLLNAAAGGGIYNGSSATIIDSSLQDNRAHGEWAWGAGISNAGVLTVEGSTIAGNCACSPWSDDGPGGIDNYGGTVVVRNTTIHGNQGGWYGGGMYNAGQNGSVSITHSTISGNQGGPGIWSRSRLDMRNTILANNGIDLDGALASSGYNLIEDPRRGSGYDRDTDVLGVDALLGPLADNGGPTLTMALLPGSPAIDAGHPNPADPPMWDQRGPGFPRVVNGRVDIGAYELQATGMGWGGWHGRETMPQRRWGGWHGRETMPQRGETMPQRSPVYGASVAAELGPALTPGVGTGQSRPAPFTGLLAVRLVPGEEPAINGGPITANAERPVNGPENVTLPWADIFRPVGAEDIDRAL
jgi:hypothetical protein